MIKVIVEVQAKQKLPLLSIFMRNKIERNLHLIGQQIVQFAKLFAPVRTGRLRDSIEYKIERLGRVSYVLQVGTDVPYAKYVELGTRCMRARPFLIPAYMATKPMIFGLFGTKRVSVAFSFDK